MLTQDELMDHDIWSDDPPPPPLREWRFPSRPPMVISQHRDGWWWSDSAGAGPCWWQPHLARLVIGGRSTYGSACHGLEDDAAAEEAQFLERRRRLPAWPWPCALVHVGELVHADDPDPPAAA